MCECVQIQILGHGHGCSARLHQVLVAMLTIFQPWGGWGKLCLTYTGVLTKF